MGKNNVQQRKETDMKGNLTSHVGAQVKYGAPTDVRAKGGMPHFGKIVDEVWATPDINTSPARKPKN